MSFFFFEKSDTFGRYEPNMFWCTSPIPNFIEIRSVVSEFEHAESDMMTPLRVMLCK
jgi:hypothetical protein